MPSSGNRITRINEEVMRALSELLRTVKDPRLASHMISVIRCEVTNDLRWCKVYLSVLGDYDSKAILAGLKSTQSYLRTGLAQAVKLRYTPELTFVLDDSIAHGVHISKIISELDIKHDEQQ